MFDGNLDVCADPLTEMKIPLPGVLVCTCGKGSGPAETSENRHVVVETLTISGRERIGNARVKHEFAKNGSDGVGDGVRQVFTTRPLAHGGVHGFHGADLNEGRVEEGKEAIVV